MENISPEFSVMLWIVVPVIVCMYLNMLTWFVTSAYYQAYFKALLEYQEKSNKVEIAAMREKLSIMLTSQVAASKCDVQLPMNPIPFDFNDKVGK